MLPQFNYCLFFWPCHIWGSVPRQQRLFELFFFSSWFRQRTCLLLHFIVSHNLRVYLHPSKTTDYKRLKLHDTVKICYQSKNVISCIVSWHVCWWYHFTKAKYRRVTKDWELCLFVWSHFCWLQIKIYLQKIHFPTLTTCLNVTQTNPSTVKTNMHISHHKTLKKHPSSKRWK